MKKAAQQMVNRANAEAVVARAELFATISQLRLRLDPRIVATEQAEALVARARRAADDARSSVEARPLIAAGALAAFVFAIGLRLWFSRRAKSRSAETGRDDISYNDAPTSRTS